MTRKPLEIINGEVARIDNELQETAKELRDLEELDVIQRYIRLLGSYEEIKSAKEKALLELKETEQMECYHLFVIGEKTIDDSLGNEVVLKCLKCGVTNGFKYATDDLPDLDKMIKIVHMTAHNGRLISDKVVLHMDEIQELYDSVKFTTNEKEIIEIISDALKHKKDKKEKDKKTK